MTFLILTTLQLLGLALAAGAAIANILKSKGVEEVRTPSLIIGGPEKVTRRLTHEAKVGVSFLIAGLVVSLVAKTVEQYLTNKRNTENHQATATQLQKAEVQIQQGQNVLSTLVVQAARNELILKTVQRQILHLDQTSLDLRLTFFVTNAAWRGVLDGIAEMATTNRWPYESLDGEVVTNDSTVVVHSWPPHDSGHDPYTIKIATNSVHFPKQDSYSSTNFGLFARNFALMAFLPEDLTAIESGPPKPTWSVTAGNRWLEIDSTSRDRVDLVISNARLCPLGPRGAEVVSLPDLVGKQLIFLPTLILMEGYPLGLGLYEGNSGPFAEILTNTVLSDLNLRFSEQLSLSLPVMTTNGSWVGSLGATNIDGSRGLEDLTCVWLVSLPNTLNPILNRVKGTQQPVYDYTGPR